MTSERLAQLHSALIIGFAGPTGSALHAYTLLAACRPTLSELEELAANRVAASGMTLRHIPQGDDDDSKLFWMEAGSDMVSRHNAEMQIIEQLRTVMVDVGPEKYLGWPPA